MEELVVDFHVHSTFSDGTLTPTDLCAAATREDFAALALTDHDTFEGASEFAAAAARRGLKAAFGVEFSVATGPLFEKCHLLGLGLDPHQAGLAPFLSRVRAGRDARNREMIANFERLGIPIRPEASGEVLARPHFAKWLVAHGYAPNLPTAFAKYLLDSSPAETRCYAHRWRPSAEETIRLIRAAGGLAVMAHPKYLRRAWRTEGVDYAVAERGLAALKEAGLEGLEALYQANTVEENIGFTHLADRLGLVKSAGSDYHGAAKPTVSLGMRVSPSFIAPLLERILP